MVYERKKKKLYYINSTCYRYHHEFCRKELEPDIDLAYFNISNYSNDPKRKYILANINYFKSLNIYALEISPVDLMPIDDIVFLWEKVSESSYIQEELHILLNSSRLQSLKSKLKSRIPLLEPVDIYRNLYYQAIGKYKSCGILNKLSRKYDFKVPECAFVIPFHYYHQHVISSSTSSLIDSLLSVKNTIPKDSLQLLLTEIRTRIKRAPIDTILMKEVNSKVSTDCVYSRFRFRSSTNAEDAKGFSGAGLYTSKTGVRNSEKKSFEKAIKKVWASLWTYEAFSERAYYHIDHKDVYMGILVHRSFPNEEVNGVAITKNIYIKQVRLYND